VQVSLNRVRAGGEDFIDHVEIVICLRQENSASVNRYNQKSK